MRRRSSPREQHALLLVACLAALNALAALGGAWGLATDVLGLGPELTARLPWGSALVGAIALALLVALPHGVLAVLAVRGDRRTGVCAVAVGVLLVGWIVVELAFLRELSFFHPFYVVVGLVLVGLGVRLVRETSGPGAGQASSTSSRRTSSSRPTP